MASSYTTHNLSPECKAFVVKKVYEHYNMNIFWMGVCQKFSTMCVFIFPVITLFSNENSTLKITIAILSALISLIVSFFCDTTEYTLTLHIVLDAFKTDCNDSSFEAKFQALIPYIREIDFARGRSDFKAYCEELDIQIKQCDMLTNHDKSEMNRQRYIIAVLCSMATIICLLLLYLVQELDIISVIILCFITASTFIGFIFMLIDCISFSRKNSKK